MPRYFFDTIDGAGLVRDLAGTDLPDDRAAREHGLVALAALPDVAKSGASDDARREFTVVVRDDMKAAIYTAELTLAGRWLKAQD